MAVSLLLSCTGRKLRSDIAEFIASFSLTDSVQAYLEAGYTSIKIEVIDEEETKTVEDFSFNVRDIENPIYSYDTKIYKNGTLSSSVNEHIEIENSKYYLVKNEVKEEYSLEQCHLLVQNFFYKEVMLDGSYHVQGMYYGDYVQQSAEYYQDYITINIEEDLYIYEVDRNSVVEDKEVKMYEKYSVNKLGMLNTLQSEMVNGANSIKQNITVYRK